MSISFQTLRELVGSTVGQKLPTAKALRESGVEIVAQASVGKDGKLTVYRNGFFTYQTNGGTTVHAVDRCAGYTYDGSDSLAPPYFDDEPWALRLVLDGVDRLEKNNNAREESKRPSLGSATYEPEHLRDPHDAYADLENQEAVDMMMACLTDRQKEVVQLYFFDGMTQQDVAHRLRLSQAMVAKHLAYAMKKMKSLTPWL